MKERELIMCNGSLTVFEHDAIHEWTGVRSYGEENKTHDIPCKTLYIRNNGQIMIVQKEDGRLGWINPNRVRILDMEDMS